MNGVFIAGTDTGVGKTTVACAMARLIAQEMGDVGVMKPVETGCRRKSGELIPADAQALKTASGTEDPMRRIAPYCYHAPLAPDAAARIEENPLRLDVILRAYERLHRRHPFLIVEGIGGLMTPLTPRLTVLDLIKRMELPVLLVARSGLGTLNHTLLSLHCGREAGLQFVGVVLNQTHPRRTLADRTNPEILSARIRVPIFHFPHSKPDPVCFDLERHDKNARPLIQLFFPHHV
jgi:dethiobiotin synthetase